MLLRSSSTPILGSLLPSDTPNRDFDTKHGGSSHSNFSPFSPFLVDQENDIKKTVGGGFRRAQSDGNLQGLLAGNDMDDFHSCKHYSRKTHHSLLETIPSFSMYNSKYGDEEENEEEDEEEEQWAGELSALKRSITIGDNINGVGSGEFSFGEHMAMIQEEQSRVLNELQSFSGNDEEGRPKSPPLYLAAGLGLSVGFGGGGEAGNGANFGLPEYGDGGKSEPEIEEYYKNMVDQNPGNSLFLRNYAQFLYQSKRDLPRAEEYYSRAILSDPGDGEMLSQYAKIVWELHHDYERASSYFERAVEVSPVDCHVNAAYASFLWETGDYDEEEHSFQQNLGGNRIFQTSAMTSAIFLSRLDMLPRSSSAPFLGSAHPSLSDAQKEYFAINYDDRHPLSNSADHQNEILFSDGGYYSNGLGAIGRAQSDGNLEDLIAAAKIDEFHSFCRPILQSVPSFAIFNSVSGHDEGDGCLRRSITIAESIKGVGREFSFGKNMDLIQEEVGAIPKEYRSFSGNDEEGRPKSPPLYMARGLGIDVGFGGGEDGGYAEFDLPEYGERAHQMTDMEEYHMKMVWEIPGSTLFLRNYAQFLYQSKGDLAAAEEYYSRAILSDPRDGEMLSQYAKIVWELHHDHEKASTYFERAVQAAPEDRFTLMRHTLVFSGKQRTRKITAFRKILEGSYCSKPRPWLLQVLKANRKIFYPCLELL